MLKHSVFCSRSSQWEKGGITLEKPHGSKKQQQSNQTQELFHEERLFHCSAVTKLVEFGCIMVEMDSHLTKRFLLNDTKISKSSCMISQKPYLYSTCENPVWTENDLHCSIFSVHWYEIRAYQHTSELSAPGERFGDPAQLLFNVSTHFTVPRSNRVRIRSATLINFLNVNYGKFHNNLQIRIELRTSDLDKTDQNLHPAIFWIKKPGSCGLWFCATFVIHFFRNDVSPMSLRQKLFSVWLSKISEITLIWFPIGTRIIFLQEGCVNCILLLIAAIRAWSLSEK